MKATKLMIGMKADKMTIPARFDPPRVEALVLDDLSITREQMAFAIETRGTIAEFAHVVIAKIISDHCVHPGESSVSVVNKQMGLYAMSNAKYLELCTRSARFDAIAQSIGVSSIQKYIAYIIGLLELTQGDSNAA